MNNTDKLTSILMQIEDSVLFMQILPFTTQSIPEEHKLFNPNSTHRDAESRLREWIGYDGVTKAVVQYYAQVLKEYNVLVTLATAHYNRMKQDKNRER